MPIRNCVLLILIVLLPACSAERVSLPPASGNPAVLALLNSADAKVGTGQVTAAAADLERALRIEPKNPMLWQELARLRLREGDYLQAANLAARSNSWSAGNRTLQAENWRIIGEARANLGDDVGAREALDQAMKLSE